MKRELWKFCIKKYNKLHNEWHTELQKKLKSKVLTDELKDFLREEHEKRLNILRTNLVHSLQEELKNETK